MQVVDWKSPPAPRGFTQFPETASSGFLTLPCGFTQMATYFIDIARRVSEASLLKTVSYGMSHDLSEASTLPYSVTIKGKPQVLSTLKGGISYITSGSKGF